MLSRLARSPVTRASSLLRSTAGISVRYQSKDSKFNNIEEFNKKKTEYNFNHKFKQLDELESDPRVGGSTETMADMRSRVAREMEEKEQDDINLRLQMDPRLAQFEYGSPEYKDMLNQINHEFNEQQKKDHKKFENRERWKALFAGFGIVGCMVVVHQALFHYKWYLALLNKSSYAIDESKIKTNPENTKKLDFLQSKLAAILDGDFVGGLLSSKENTGLYVFGGQNGKKLPTRIAFFNGMILRDVKVCGNLLIVVADGGSVYQLTKEMATPEKLDVPYNIVKCEISKDLVYLLDKNGKVIYTPRADKNVSIEGSTSRNWLLMKKQNSYDLLKYTNESGRLFNRGEYVTDISSGESHMLLLTNKGRLFNVKVGEAENFGQYGTPNYAPVYNPNIKTNEVFEMTLLNKELVSDGNTKTLRSRVFTSIATGKYHSLVSDADGNVWAWGKNSFGQCGVELNFKSDVQPIPYKVLDLPTASNLLKSNVISVTGLYASDETSFIKTKLADDSEALLSFGNGVKGQLGINRFLHLSHIPQTIKALNVIEYNEEKNKSVNIGIKNISVGSNHAVVQLDNSGNQKDVLMFGDNESGQFGNGKLIRSSKPVAIPNLVEPEDVGKDIKTSKQLTKRMNNPDNRLSLSEELKINGVLVEQTIVATGDSSVIFYKRK